MNYERKSRKGFFALTLLTIISIASVVAVYAVLVGQYTSTGEVTVGGVAASTVTYSSDNTEAGSWDNSLVRSSTSDSWYCRLEIPGTSYSGPVTITWQLEEKTQSDPDVWTNVTSASFTTNMVLTGNAQDVYATTDGAFAAANHDWGTNDYAGTFRVMAYIESS